MAERLRAVGVVAVVLLTSLLVTVSSAAPAGAAVPPAFVTAWGSAGTGNGQFSLAWGIAVDGSGNVYVVDADRVQKFTSTGGYLAQWGTAGSGNGQFNDPNGHRGRPR